MRSVREQAGQASVELVALLPLVILVAAALWQAAIAGQAAWLVGSAARSAARANAVGGDAASAARHALPRSLRGGVSVHAGDDGTVRVGVGVPAILGAGRVATFEVRAHFEPQAQ